MNIINPALSLAERHISNLLLKQVPYNVEIFGNEFIVRDHNTYPSGRLTKMFGEFITDSGVTRGKVVADIGMGSFALGIMATQNGAKHVIGSDIISTSLDIAKSNVEHNKVNKDIISLYQGNSVYPLLPEFKRKIDIIFSGMPWDSMSGAEFEQIPDIRKSLSYSLYDIDDEMIKGFLSDGFKLLSNEGRVFITSAQSHIGRVEKFCAEYNVEYKIAKEEDIHKDGNIHFILELLRS